MKYAQFRCIVNEAAMSAPPSFPTIVNFLTFLILVMKLLGPISFSIAIARGAYCELQRDQTSVGPLLAWANLHCALQPWKPSYRIAEHVGLRRSEFPQHSSDIVQAQELLSETTSTRSLAMGSAEMTLSPMDLLLTTAQDLQRMLNAGSTTSVDLVKASLEQIINHDQEGMKLRAMISVASRAQLLEQAKKLDEERKTSLRSPLHVIPYIVKVMHYNPLLVERRLTVPRHFLHAFVRFGYDVWLLCVQRCPSFHGCWYHPEAHFCRPYTGRKGKPLGGLCWEFFKGTSLTRLGIGRCESVQTKSGMVCSGRTGQDLPRIEQTRTVTGFSVNLHMSEEVSWKMQPFWGHSVGFA